MERDWMTKPAGKPLDHLLPDGGYVSIFRTIGCIGDSLSSGEFEGKNAEGNKTYRDVYEESWGQYMARIAGVKAYNFSKGGMSAKVYLESFADDHGFWNRDLACKAYIMALGVNDINLVKLGRLEFGELSDIDPENWRNNRHTFVGSYAAILQRYHEIAPHAFFFLMTMPHRGVQDETTAMRDQHRELLYRFAEMFPNTFVLDFRQYAPVYDDDFYRTFGLGGHLNSMGYLLTARMVIAYIGYLIRSDMPRFARVGCINTPWENEFWDA